MRDLVTEFVNCEPLSMVLCTLRLAPAPLVLVLVLVLALVPAPLYRFLSAALGPIESVALFAAAALSPKPKPPSFAAVVTRAKRWLFFFLVC
jgi:hypothetical protein